MTVISAVPRISFEDASKGAAVRAYYDGGLVTSKGSYEIIAENASVKDALRNLKDGSVVSVIGSVYHRPNEMKGYKVTSLKVVGTTQTIPGAVQRKHGKFYAVNGNKSVELKAATPYVKQQLELAVTIKHSIVKGFVDSKGVAQVFSVSLPMRTLPAAAPTA